MANSTFSLSVLPLAGHDEYIATGGETEITLSFSYTLGTKRLMVFLNGIYQNVDDDYTETSLTKITFSNALVAGDVVITHLT